MIRRLSFVLVAALAPQPAVAQFNCQTGDVITVHLLPRPFGGFDYCVPDRVDPPLLCTFCTYEPALVRWRIESTCDGAYTVKIIGSGLKANITGPLPCDPEKDYQGTVQGDESLVCSLPTVGKYGYLIAVCRPDGHCAYTDPGIWVNRRGATAEYPGTQSEYDAALAESRKICVGDGADLQKLLQRTPPERKPAQTPKSIKP